MFHLILHEPEIPPNTGNVIRLTVNCGARLHLVRPLGFSLDDASLRRAGLDYRDRANIREHADLATCLATLDGARVFAVETGGGRRHDEPRYQAGDAFLLGRETTGLPRDVLVSWPADRLIHLPMVPGNRSLNLGNAAAVILYEAWRQLGFPGADPVRNP